jgi:hypothetical protein
MQTDDSDEQVAEAWFSMQHRLPSHSKMTVESDARPEKQDWQISLTVEGMQMDETDE